MTVFEKHLRDLLRDTAEPVTWRQDRHLPAPPRKARSTMVLATAATVIIGGLVAGLAITKLTTDNTTEEAQCPAILEWKGTAYRPRGELMRTPVVGEQLATPALRPGCDDGNNGGDQEANVRVNRIKGLPPEQGFLAGGVVFISDEAGPAAEDLTADLNAEFPCPLTKSSVLTGQVLGILPARPASADLPAPPYVLNFQATSGAGLPWDAYSALTIQIQVTSSTVGADQGAAITRSLSEGAPLKVSTECGPGYTAQSIQGN